MLKRIVTGAILIPIVVLVVYWAPTWVVAIVAAAVALLAMMEFFKLTAQMGLRAFREWTMICTAVLFGVQWLLGVTEVRWLGPNTEVIRGLAGSYESPEVLILLFVLGCACIGVMSRMPIADVLPGIGASAAGLVFVALPFSYLVRLDGQATRGSLLVLFTLAIVWAGDTLAYFVGKFLGRTKMAPALSPKKTWEGAAGNMLGSLIVGYCFARGLHYDAMSWLATAALANVAGQVGDLVESAYKRGAGAKDSGALLPGHGGMLDRIDSLILAAPVVWLAAGWLLQGRQ
ncbi:MAG TPA: phosphatidate cytidylyltransferase [Candidatus Acidoferrales bacterium]|nr:phosphatidate cytidylyltransferase [Candidatus Acidoferrales bacterium]